MIYHLPLQLAGFSAGAFLLLIGMPGLLMPHPTRTWLASLPRSKVAGVVFLTVAAVWTFWLLATMEMGEFSSFRRPLLFALPVGYVLVLWFVNELLAARALGILSLLAAEPLLDAAFLRYEPSRLLVTVFAYILIVLGLFWVTMPYLMRDQITWAARSTARLRMTSAAAAIYGAVILVVAFTAY